MANLTDFQREQNFGFCTGSPDGQCDQGLNGTPVLLTPFNGPSNLCKDGYRLYNHHGRRCYLCDAKNQHHLKATNEQYHLNVQYSSMGKDQGERTSECRALMEEVAPDQPNCCYCAVPLVDLSFRFNSSSPEREEEEIRSYLSADQTVKRCCVTCNFGLKGHTPEEKRSFHDIASLPIANGIWYPSILHNMGRDDTLKALQELDVHPNATGLPPGINPPSTAQAGKWRGKVMQKARDRMKPHGEEPDFDCTYLTALLKAQCNRCAKYGVKGVQARNSLWSLSLDRIDSSRWYYKDNIIFVLKVANLGKNSKDDLEFCEYLIDLHG
jgi:hypothetical protein